MWRRALLSLSVLVGGLVFIELMLRLVAPIEIIRARSGGRDNSLGWGPDVEAVCQPLPETNKPGWKRIMVVGDSILNCWDAKDADQKVPGVLRILLTPRQIQVLNLSSGGWGTDQEFLAYEQIGKKYKPELVFLFFTAVNDLSNNISTFGNSPPTSKPHFELVGGDDLDLVPRSLRPPRPEWERWAMQTQMGLRLFYRPRKFDSNPDRKETIGAFLTPEPEWVKQSWEVTRRILRKFAQSVRDNGGELVLVYVPSGIDPEEADCGPNHCIGYQPRPFTLTCNETQVSFDIYQPFRRLKKIASDLDIPLLDNLAQMEAHQDHHKNIAYDCLHLTPLGSTLLGERVEHYVKTYFDVTRLTMP